MSTNITLSFSLIFASVIALICAVYVALIQRRKNIDEFNKSNKEVKI